MAFPPQPPTLINPQWVTEAELAQTSLDAVKRSYEGNTDGTCFMGKEQRNFPSLTADCFCSF